jgi:hypothetical protein
VKSRAIRSIISAGCRAVHLPRAIRRRIRAMQHHARLGQLDAPGQKRLRGWEALMGMIERQG